MREETTVPSGDKLFVYNHVYRAMSKSIRVDEQTHAALKSLKRENETFNDLLTRLVEERTELVEAGAGLWEGTDAAEKAREYRNEMKQGIGEQ